MLYGCDTSSSDTLFTSLDPVSIGIGFRNDIQETMDNNILKNEYYYNGGGVAAGDINNSSCREIFSRVDITLHLHQYPLKVRNGS